MDPLLMCKVKGFPTQMGFESVLQWTGMLPGSLCSLLSLDPNEHNDR